MTDKSFEGFYAVYLAASAGEGLVLIALTNGVVAGADMGGFEYTGTYARTDGEQFIVRLKIKMTPFQSSILGLTAGKDGLEYSVEFKLQSVVSFDNIIRIDTPYGPVNAKFRKLRDFPEKLT